MPAGEQIALQPALTEVLAQDLHHPAVCAQVHVDGFDLGHPGLAGDLVDRIKPVRSGFVGTKQTEVAAWEVQLDDITQKPPSTRVASAMTAPGREISTA